MITEFDTLEIRCPMLGHPLNFSYCRSTDSNTPCRKIYNCWYQRIPVQQFVKEHFSQEIIEKITAPPQPKMLSLLELVEKAKQTKKNGGIPHDDVEL